MLKTFRAENQRAIRLAQCDAVPPVMVIAGPNGVGKSTLLSAMHRRQIQLQFDGDTTILYQPPHRAIRRQRVQRRYLMGALKSFVATLTGNDVQGFEGLPIQYPARLPDNVDEAGSTLKFTLGQFENRRQAMLAKRVDTLAESGATFETATLPKVYAPLGELTQRLLPHLAFKHIEFTDQEDVRCVFVRTDGVATDPLDLDDLSSGEKAIFLLFLPLIEDEIQSRLRSLGGDAMAAPAPQQRLFLIDEPEQHLHPDLQSRILGYLRDQAASHGVQLIVATHSPTLVDQATDAELHVLGFATAAGANQLRRVATNADRLAAIRAIAGTTYPVTTGRTIVCLEGVRHGRAATDLGLLGVLAPDATRYTFVALGSRGHVLRAVPEFRERLLEEGYGIAVYGIVDRDQGDPGVPNVVTWDVAMIENLLLLDVAAIGAAATSLLHSGVESEAARNALADAAADLRDDEVSLRVSEAIGFLPVRIRGASSEAVLRELAEARSKLERDQAEVARIVDEAAGRVDSALSDGSFVRTFRGKLLLSGLHQRLGLSGASVGLDTFAYTLAQECARRGSAKARLDAIFSAFHGGESA